MITMIFVIMTVTLLVDAYFYSATNSVFQKFKYFKTVYWSSSFLILLAFAIGYFSYLNGFAVPRRVMVFIQGLFFCLFVPKLLAITFFMIDDVIRFFRWLVTLISPSQNSSNSESGISRLKFLQLTGLGVFAVLFTTLGYGIVKGAYNYQVIKKKLKIKGLPKAFEGLKIVQISDIHTGSFMSTNPLEEAVALINEQKPDIIFFTGDLVNEISEEALPYIDTLKKLQAPKGIYSILGNHDYGDYFYKKDDPEFLNQKKHNKDLMKSIHQQMGFKLLLDENVILKEEGCELAIIGIENWGAKGRFPKYGDLAKAIAGTEHIAAKLLLSHDPSHWEAQVLREFKDISATFSGHTHGMQFGIEIPGIKWSPVKYMYPQWAGLYQSGEQKLYVNRGLGFIGYPGRVGISPEITVFELEQES